LFLPEPKVKKQIDALAGCAEIKALKIQAGLEHFFPIKLIKYTAVHFVIVLLLILAKNTIFLSYQDSLREQNLRSRF